MFEHEVIALENKNYEHDDLIFVLEKKGTSSWEKKAPHWKRDNPKADVKNPRRINCAKVMYLPLEGNYQSADPELRNQPVMYVPGADTLFINDIKLKDGTVKKGLRSQGYDIQKEARRVGLNLGIQFINGVLYAENYQAHIDPLLKDFILHHDSFLEAEGFVRNPRRVGTVYFKRLQKEKLAAAAIDTLDRDTQAMNLVNGLRKPIMVKGKVDGYEYDRVRLNALLGIFGLGKGLKEGDDNQKMNSLVLMAKFDGAKMMQLFEDAVEDMRSDIMDAAAAQYGLITITAKEAKLNLGELKNKRTIVTFKKDQTSEENMNEIIYHFLGTESGKNDYNQLCTELDEAKAKKN